MKEKKQTTNKNKTKKQTHVTQKRTIFHFNKTKNPFKKGLKEKKKNEEYYTNAFSYSKLPPHKPILCYITMVLICAKQDASFPTQRLTRTRNATDTNTHPNILDS